MEHMTLKSKTKLDISVVRPKRVCPICLGTYTPKTKHQKFCKECRINRRYDIELYRAGLLRPEPKENEKLHAMQAEIEAYNKKHGTCLTYGKYLHLKTYGLLAD